jgi:hypothetical protein
MVTNFGNLNIPFVIKKKIPINAGETMMFLATNKLNNLDHHHHHHHHQPITVHCIQLLPAVLRKSSLHLAWGRPTLRLPRRGLHSRTRLPQRLSVRRLIWPAHCHFSMLIRCAMSVTLLLCRITWFRIRSRRETPSIALSIPRWATLNLWTSRAVSFHVSAPYVMTGRTHWLKTFVFGLCGIDDENNLDVLN